MARRLSKKTIGDPEVVKLFNEMLGTDKCDPQVIVPKYESILKNLEDIVSVLRHFSISPVRGVFYADFSVGFDELTSFVKASTEMLQELQLPLNDGILTAKELQGVGNDPKDIEKMVSDVSFQYKLAGLGTRYNFLKECLLTREVVMMTRNIKNALAIDRKIGDARTELRHDLDDPANLKADFILNTDGDCLSLFGFSRLDFKGMFCYEKLMTPGLSLYILSALRLLYIKGMEVVRCLTSPDVDVNKFSELLVTSLEDMRKRIPRCDKAFDKIMQSVGLLRNNFDDYYKDFIVSQNPSVIVENFVFDVSKDTKSDPVLTAQFRTIIKYYHQFSARRVKNPSTEKIFAALATSMDALEGAEKRKTRHRKAEPPVEPVAVAEPNGKEPAEEEEEEMKVHHPRKRHGYHHHSKK